MPRHGTSDFYVGLIRGRMQCIKEIQAEMDNDTLPIDRAGQLNLQRRLRKVNADIQIHLSLVSLDERIVIQQEYEEMSAHADLSLDAMLRVEVMESGTEEEGEPYRPNLSPEAREPQPGPSANTGAVRKARKTAKKTKRAGHDLDDYVTDNEEPMAAAVMSIINPAPDFEPVRFQPQDLRFKISRNPARSSENTQRVPELTFEPYVAQAQPRMKGPVDHVTFSPRLNAPPFPLKRWDAGWTLVGKAEVYFTTQRYTCCCYCWGKHGLHSCNSFKTRENLENRWQFVLSKGLCLSCLLTGHSSFTCRLSRTCRDCGQRHNSILCPVIYQRNHQ